MLQRLAIITTHPIQYNAPLFAMLEDREQIKIKVFYTWGEEVLQNKYDPGFDKTIEWDIPLLNGYEYTFVTNIANSPGSHHYKGVNNPTLIKEIQEWGANALLVYGWNFKSHWAVIRFFYKKIPIFFRGDSTLLDEKIGVKQLLRRILLKFVYSYIDKALYAGIANKDYFKAMGLEEKQLIFMPHAIDNSRFATNDKYEHEAVLLKNKLGIEKGALIFLFAGKLDDNKNVALLINAFIGLNTKAHYLLIVGNGIKEMELREMSKKFDNIIFLNFQNQKQMPAIYAAADVFVLPSKSETWGLSINEAMAAGKPIIASNTIGATFDLVKNNENGFVFKSADVTHLQKTLEHFINDVNSVSLMGKVSLEMIQEYSFAKDCEVIETIINNELSGSN